MLCCDITVYPITMMCESAEIMNVKYVQYIPIWSRVTILCSNILWSEMLHSLYS